jgi:hypothetical protein
MKTVFKLLYCGSKVCFKAMVERICPGTIVLVIVICEGDCALVWERGFFALMLFF